MYICPTCGAETNQPSHKNNRPYCANGHRTFDESASRGLLSGLLWGLLLLGLAAVGQAWILAIPLAAAGISLYKAWRLSRHERPSRRLAKRFSSFGVGVLLPIGLLIYPGLKQLHVYLVSLFRH